MKKIILCLCLMTSTLSFSLEIDEKLTLRIVKTSESRKTILINRGLEDGLAKGDHAKFYVSEGVVARGVVIKSSPTRSVWSIYRLVNNTFLQNDQVMKLKITPAVKITKDESRMMVKDDTIASIGSRDPRDLGIPLADGAEDLDELENSETALGPDTKGWISNENTSLLSRNREVYGMIDFSMLNEKTTPSTSTNSYSNDIMNINFLIGGEWYFKDEANWLSRVSVAGHFRMDRQGVMGHQGEYVRTESSEFGGGANFYLGTRPSMTYKLIPYLNGTIALGSISSTYEPGDAGGSTTEKSSSNGASIMYSFGFGYKYYTPQGFGARLLMSYLLRADQYSEDSGTASNASWQNQRVGPTLNFGLSYRF